MKWAVSWGNEVPITEEVAEEVWTFKDFAKGILKSKASHGVP